MFHASGVGTTTLNGKWMVVKIVTNGTLPTLISRLAATHWQTSIDGSTWLRAETDSRYCRPAILPTSQIDDTYATKAVKVTPLRNALCNGDTLSLGKGGRVIVDFRQLEVGRVKLKPVGHARLKLNVGESVEEAMCGDSTKYEQRPLPEIIVNGSGEEVALPERALRFLSISTDAPCKMPLPVFEMRVWPAQQKLAFRCSNDTINALFDAGVATLLTSMHNFNLDGVKRDYLPWALDAVLSSIGTNWVFGERQVARNDLSIALMPPMPAEQDWEIVDYPLHALIGLEAYEQRYGDDGTADMFRDRIESQMNLYMKRQDSRGFISAPSGSQGFIPGWSAQNGPETMGMPAYAQMILYRNFTIAARLERRWGATRQARIYEKKAATLRRNIVECFWDEGRHAFVNGFHEDGTADRRLSHYTQYWAVLAGIYPKQHQRQLYTAIVPALPGHRSNVSYDRGYEAMAMVKTGNVEALKSILINVWYDWLEKGNTRFPENFSYKADTARQLSFYNRPFGLSLCHGANGVPPIVLALNGILGFSTIADGHYKIAPRLLGMKWAKGSIAVKEGTIEVELAEDARPIVKHPKGCRVDVACETQENALRTDKCPTPKKRPNTY